MGAPFNGSCERDLSWQDRQGAIRFTMVSGSITVDSIIVESILPGPSLSSYDVYSETFTPVPEPTVTSLLAVALCSGLICAAQRKQRGMR